MSSQRDSALQQAYEELKRKLQMEGLFDAARKNRCHQPLATLGL